MLAKIQDKKRRYNLKTTSGFSLIEILVVGVIIAILSAFAIPEYQRARIKSKGEVESNNLRIIEEAKAKFSQANPGKTPTSEADIIKYTKEQRLPKSPWGVTYTNVLDLTLPTASPANGEAAKEPKTQENKLTNGYNDLGGEQNIYLEAPRPDIAYFTEDETPNTITTGQEFVIYERNLWTDAGTGYNPADAPAPEYQRMAPSSEWYTYTQDDRALNYAHNDPWWGGRKVDTSIVDDAGPIPIPVGSEFGGTVVIAQPKTWITHNYSLSQHILTLAYSASPVSIANGPNPGAVRFPGAAPTSTNFGSSNEGNFPYISATQNLLGGADQKFEFGETPTISAYVNRGWEFMGFFAASGDGRNIAQQQYTTTTFNFDKIGSDPTLPSGPGQMGGSGPYGQTWGGAWTANNQQRTMDHTVEARYQAVPYILTVNTTGGTFSELQSFNITGSTYPGMSNVTSPSATFYWGDRANLSLVPRGGTGTDQTANNVWGVVNWSGDLPTHATSPSGPLATIMTTGHRPWNVNGLEVSYLKWPAETNRAITLNLEKYFRVRQVIVNLTDPGTNPVWNWYPNMNGEPYYTRTWVSPRMPTQSESQWFNAGNGRYNGVGNNPYVFYAPPNPSGQYGIFSITYPTGASNVPDNGLSDDRIINPNNIPPVSAPITSDTTAVNGYAASDAIYSYRRYGIITVQVAGVAPEHLGLVNALAYARPNNPSPYVNHRDTPNYVLHWIGDMVRLEAETTTYLYQFSHWRRESDGAQEPAGDYNIEKPVSTNETWTAVFEASQQRQITFQVLPAGSGTPEITAEEISPMLALPGQPNILRGIMGARTPFVASVTPTRIVTNSVLGDPNWVPQGTHWEIEQWEISGANGSAQNDIILPPKVPVINPILGNYSGLSYGNNIPAAAGNYTITARMRRSVPDLARPTGTATDRIRYLAQGGGGDFLDSESTRDRWGQPGAGIGIPASVRVQGTSIPAEIRSDLTIKGGDGYDQVPWLASQIIQGPVFPNVIGAPAPMREYNAEQQIYTSYGTRQFSLSPAVQNNVRSSWTTNVPNWKNPSGNLTVISSGDAINPVNLGRTNNDVSITLEARADTAAAGGAGRSILFHLEATGTFGAANAGNRGGRGFYNPWEADGPSLANPNPGQSVPIRIRVTGGGGSFTSTPTHNGDNGPNNASITGGVISPGAFFQNSTPGSSEWRGGIRLNNEGKFTGSFAVTGNSNTQITVDIYYREARTIPHLANTQEDTINNGVIRIFRYNSGNNSYTNQDTSGVSLGTAPFDADTSNNNDIITLDIQKTRYKPKTLLSLTSDAPYWVGELIDPQITGINSPTQASRVAVPVQSMLVRLNINGVVKSKYDPTGGMIGVGQTFAVRWRNMGLGNNGSNPPDNQDYLVTTPGQFNITGRTDITSSVYFSSPTTIEGDTVTVTVDAYRPSDTIRPEFTLEGITTTTGNTTNTSQVPQGAVVVAKVSAQNTINRPIPGGMGVRFTLPAGWQFLEGSLPPGVTGTHPNYFILGNAGSTNGSITKTFKLKINAAGTATAQAFTAPSLLTPITSNGPIISQTLTLSSKQYGDFKIKSFQGTETLQGQVRWDAEIARGDNADPDSDYTVLVTGDIQPQLGLSGVEYARTPNLKKFGSIQNQFNQNVVIPRNGTGIVPITWVTTLGNTYLFPTVQGIVQIDPNNVFADNNDADDKEIEIVELSTGLPDVGIKFIDPPPYLEPGQQRPIRVELTVTGTPLGGVPINIYYKSEGELQNEWKSLGSAVSSANPYTGEKINFPVNYPTTKSDGTPTGMTMIRAVYETSQELGVQVQDSNSKNNSYTTYIPIGVNNVSPVAIPAQQGLVWKTSSVVTKKEIKPSGYDPVSEDPNTENVGFDRPRYKQITQTITQTLTASGEKRFTDSFDTVNAKGNMNFSGSVTLNSQNLYKTNSTNNKLGSVIGTFQPLIEQNRSFILDSTFSEKDSGNPKKVSLNLKEIIYSPTGSTGTFFVKEFPGPVNEPGPQGKYTHRIAVGSNYDMKNYIKQIWDDWFSIQNPVGYGNGPGLVNLTKLSENRGLGYYSRIEDKIETYSKTDQTGGAGNFKEANGTYNLRTQTLETYSLAPSNTVKAKDFVADFLEVETGRSIGDPLPANITKIEREEIKSSFNISKTGSLMTSEETEGWIHVYMPQKPQGTRVTANYSIRTTVSGYGSSQGGQMIQGSQTETPLIGEALTGADRWAHIPVQGLGIISSGIVAPTFVMPPKPVGYPTGWPWPLYRGGFTTTGALDAEGWPIFTTAPHWHINNGIPGWGWGRMVVVAGGLNQGIPNGPAANYFNHSMNPLFQGIVNGYRTQGVGYWWTGWPTVAAATLTPASLFLNLTYQYSPPWPPETSVTQTTRILGIYRNGAYDSAFLSSSIGHPQQNETVLNTFTLPDRGPYLKSNQTDKPILSGPPGSSNWTNANGDVAAPNSINQWAGLNITKEVPKESISIQGY